MSSSYAYRSRVPAAVLLSTAFLISPYLSFINKSKINIITDVVDAHLPLTTIKSRPIHFALRTKRASSLLVTPWNILEKSTLNVSAIY